MSRQLLFIFPALNSLVKALAPIIGKEIPYICIVFKLLVNFCLTVFLFFKYPIIRSNRIGVSFARIAFKLFLKCNIKRKSVADMFLKKRSVLFRANKIRLNFRVSCNIADYLCLFLHFLCGDNLACIKKMCYSLGYFKFSPDVGKPYRRQKSTSSSFK